MAQHIIEVRVDEKIASVVGDPLYVCGNSDYIVKFSFDAEWAGHETKTARFIKSNKEYIDVVFAGDQCAVPIIDNTPYVRIGVFAGNLCTTTAAIVNAQRSILCGSGVPTDPDPDVYAQMMARFDELFQRDVKTDSEKLGGKPASDYALKSETAPDGFGLGHARSLVTYNGGDLDTLTAPGWYFWDAQTSTSIAGISSRYWYIHIIAYGDGHLHCKQEINPASRGHYGSIVRKCSDGTWGEYEHEIPPMVPGVEYRTIKRANGKVVYTKRLVYETTDVGEDGKVSSITIAHAISNLDTITMCNAKLGNNYFLPYMSSNGGLTMLSQHTANSLIVRTNGAWSGVRTWTFDMEYTKT